VLDTGKRGHSSFLQSTLADIVGQGRLARGGREKMNVPFLPA
jgi:hypothetical protein